MKEKLNLNELQIDTDDSPIDLIDHSVSMELVTFDKVESNFRDLEGKLIKKIEQFEDGFIFGSVAWLTSFPVLDALAKCKNVQLIVQKEDFLRPDLDTYNKSNWKKSLQAKYANLKCPHTRYELNDSISELSYASSNPWVDPIRCMGNHNSDKAAASPRVHNKFLVFCKIIDKTEKEEEDKDKNDITINYKPVAVWTGSFNFTKNATYSFENSIYLEDQSGDNPILNSYLKEHHQIFALSEPLNWEVDWVYPEYRIGT